MLPAELVDDSLLLVDLIASLSILLNSLMHDESVCSFTVDRDADAVPSCSGGVEVVFAAERSTLMNPRPEASSEDGALPCGLFKGDGSCTPPINSAVFATTDCKIALFSSWSSVCSILSAVSPGTSVSSLMAVESDNVTGTRPLSGVCAGPSFAANVFVRGDNGNECGVVSLVCPCKRNPAPILGVPANPPLTKSDGESPL
jgi:hypothetical protein